MSAILDHLSQVSIFGRSLVWFVVLLGLDWIFSAVHAYEEWRGEGVPLWRVSARSSDFGFRTGWASCCSRWD
jgi:hypothetical protein